MTASLRRRAASGMLQLAVRHMVGLLLSIGSIGLLLRYFSAAEYGKIVLAQGIWFFFAQVASAGLDAYIIRCHEEISAHGMRRMYAAALAIIVGLFALWLLGASVLETDPATRRIVLLMGVTYLLRAAAVVPSAVMEAELRFAPSGIAEVAGQLAYVTLLATLLHRHASLEAVVYAQMASAAISTATILWRAKLAPAFPPGGPEFAKGIRFGLRFQASVWLWQSKDFIAPIVVTWAAGPALLGTLGMANQITQRLLFFRQIIWRVAAAAMSRLRADREKMASAVQLGGDAQASILGIVLLGISALLCVLEMKTGSRWSGVSRIFPAVAIGIYVNSLFSIGCSALFSGGHIRALSVFHVLYVALYIGTLASMRVLPPLAGYYAAEVVACAAYVFLFFAISKHTGPMDLTYAGLVGGIVLAGMATGTIGGRTWALVASAAAMAMLIALPRSRFVVELLAGEVRGAVGKPSNG